MQQDLELTFRDIEPSDAIKDQVHDKVDKLEHVCDKIISCHVVIEQVQKNKHQGKLYAVNIVVSVPGKVFVANKHKDEDVYNVLRDSFNAMARLLETWAQRQDGEVKHHAEQQQGTVARLYGEDGYGFIRDGVGNDYYFTGANMHNSSFPSLEIGTKVHFIIAEGDEGPQAHRVSVFD